MQTDQEFSTALHLDQFPGQSLVTRYNTSSNPDEATAQTIDAMTRCAIEDSQSPVVFEATRQALATCGATVDECAAAIFDWVKSHIAFQQDDPVLQQILGLDNELDLLIRPARLLTMSRPAEDCDGFSMLACSMLLCGGVPCEYITLKADPSDPSRFSHVYCAAVRPDGLRIPLDCSHGPQPGWEAPQYYKRKTWGVMFPAPVSNGLHGYAGLGDGEYIDPETGLPVTFAPMPTTTSGVSTPSSSSPGFDINKFIQQITAGTFSIAKMQATPIGYVQTPNMIANYGPGGAMPLNIGNPLSGISTTTLLLLAAAGVAVFAFSGRH